MELTKESLLADLRAIGIKEGDVLLVHSALRTLGKVDGGAEAVLEALLTAVGKTGTLMMPSFQSGSEYILASQGVVFDVLNTPSDCGYLTELFRHYPGAKRSLSPTHSVTAFGAKADMLIEGHEKCRMTTGHGSPFERLIELNGKILMLGAKRHSNTTMHHIENTGGAPSVCCTLFNTAVIDAQGNRIETPIYPHMPGLARNYPYAIELLERAGGVSARTIGNARVELYDAKLLRDVAYAELRKNPCAFIQVFTPGEEEEGK